MSTNKRRSDAESNESTKRIKINRTNIVRSLDDTDIVEKKEIIIYGNPDFTDISIITDKYIIQTNKNIIYHQSKVLRETLSKECSELDLTLEDSETVKLVFLHIIPETEVNYSKLKFNQVINILRFLHKYDFTYRYNDLLNEFAQIPSIEKAKKEKKIVKYIQLYQDLNAYEYLPKIFDIVFKMFERRSVINQIKLTNLTKRSLEIVVDTLL